MENSSTKFLARCKASGAQPGGLTDGSRGSPAWRRPPVERGEGQAPRNGVPEADTPAMDRTLASLRDADARRRWTGGLATLRPPATVFHPFGMNQGGAAQSLPRRRSCPGAASEPPYVFWCSYQRIDNAALRKWREMASVFCRGIKFVFDILCLREHQEAKRLQAKWPAKPTQKRGHP
jgi:hypothetical protein